MLVSEIMNSDIKKITTDASIKEAAEIMTKNKVGCLIVVDGPKLAGIITESDVLEKVVVKDRPISKTKVRDVMVEKVIYISPDTPIEEAAEIMTKNDVKKLPIVLGKKLLGIVTATDLVAAEPKLLEHISELILVSKKQKSVAG